MFNFRMIEGIGLLAGRFTGVLDVSAAEQIVEFVESTELSAGIGFNRFCDLSRLEGIHLSTDDILRLAARRRNFNPNLVRVKSAFLATNPLTFGISRMYEQLLDSPRIEVRVWSDAPSAAAWLGVDADLLTV